MTMPMPRPSHKLGFLCGFLTVHLCFIHQGSAQRTCPNCGSMSIPYPLSTNPACGNPDYSLRCDPGSGKLYFVSLNGSSYLVNRIIASSQRMVVQPSPWTGSSCVTRDALVSEGLWLNQTLPFNITSSNTIFLFNCSPRLLVSPLNCTSSSLCHRYLESSGHIDKARAAQCAGGLDPCCTFVAGGLPSAYKIRLHSSGCRAFRSILHLDPCKPPNQWEEGLEVQWAPPPEPLCRSQLDCSRNSQCLRVAPDGPLRCLCNKGYFRDRALGTCLRTKKHSYSTLSIKISTGVICFLCLTTVAAAITLRKSRRLSSRAKLAKAREDMLKSNNCGKSARMFSLKEVKKATSNFSRDRLLGSGGFGEVYRGELPDGTLVAIKSAKVGNIKSTQQVLNEVGILSQVNHKNLVKPLGCCMEADVPLMVYEYIANGTLHDHLHGKRSTFLDWTTRLKIALQTAEALAYLHSAAYTPIYHRDVKSTNILLDDEFNAKVGDFGLSRLAEPGLSHVSTCAQGTLGYLDPEYYRNYQLTDKSDVYSFGIVLLELLTSQKAIDFARDDDDVNLAIFVSQRAKSGDLMEVVDRKLLVTEPSTDILNSVRLFSELAFACLGGRKQDRPSMKDVVKELQCIIQPECQAEWHSVPVTTGQQSSDGP
ncbi:wall-associated receptor kinase-like 20 [Rhodamnia argentea]|uniref:Wall-associated receptor kinase-like 20 n=1 Tax=Rhodamnia argentea TaxID=178133 RepID=A0A8B8PIP3_9MYRT|nr:wall-associated receptor kinase-like 20 [Rhodamnia argentea]